MKSSISYDFGRPCQNGDIGKGSPGYIESRSTRLFRILIFCLNIHVEEGLRHFTCREINGSMATFMDVDRVQYVTSSGVKAPICKLYFCRHCLKLRSTECVSHEVTYFFVHEHLDYFPNFDKISCLVNQVNCSTTILLMGRSHGGGDNF